MTKVRILIYLCGCDSDRTIHVSVHCSSGSSSRSPASCVVCTLCGGIFSLWLHSNWSHTRKKWFFIIIIVCRMLCCCCRRIFPTCGSSECQVTYYLLVGANALSFWLLWTAYFFHRIIGTSRRISHFRESCGNGERVVVANIVYRKSNLLSAIVCVYDCRICITMKVSSTESFTRFIAYAPPHIYTKCVHICHGHQYYACIVRPLYTA